MAADLTYYCPPFPLSRKVTVCAIYRRKQKKKMGFVLLWPRDGAIAVQTAAGISSPVSEEIDQSKRGGLSARLPRFLCRQKSQ